MKAITLCLCTLMVSQLLTGCETQPVKPQFSPHQEKGRDAYKGWAVTGCIALMEHTTETKPDRAFALDLCRTMTDLYQKNQCRRPIPVNRSEEIPL